MSKIPSILLVDTEPAVQYRLSSALQRRQFQVASVDCAVQAFEFLRTQKVDLVVLELRLPDADGICLLSMVRRLHPRMPVIIHSRDHSIESMLKALRMGARGYLEKPIAAEQVAQCVKDVLNETQVHLRRKRTLYPLPEF